MLVWAVLLWQVGKITAGDVVVIGSLSLVVLQASRDLAVALVDLTYHWNRLREAVEVLALPHDRLGHSGFPALLCRHGAIELQRVSFSYAEGQTVLSGLDLRIEAGERVGIVGASGSGKTTLLSLLQSLHAPTHGRILIDSLDVTANGPASLHKAVAVVPQDVSLFNRSVLENIRYGCPDASDADIMLAARAARCDQFIQELPQGYETIVGERGMRLSGGQRQRLGIARALLVDAPILLLDEATSALDAASEAAIQEALSQLMVGRTVLAATHRLSTIMSFDRVIVLQGGRITEDGTPADLCCANGLFASLWRMQSGNPTRTNHMDHIPTNSMHELADTEPSIRRFG
jgi:ATP-binding cassette subfamily B protein